MFLTQFINGYFSHRVEVYIEQKTTLYASNYIEEALRTNVAKQIPSEELYTMVTNKDDVVSAIYINTSKVNYILSMVHSSIQDSLQTLKDEKLTLPFGIIFSETLFSNVGPYLKIRIIPIGSYVCDIVTTMNDYGINNSLFEIDIKVEIQINTILPLKKGTSIVNCNIPLVVQILQGSVPRYYYNTDKVVPDVYDK